jgi:hypothetical protein
MHWIVPPVSRIMGKSLMHFNLNASHKYDEITGTGRD